MHLEFYLSKYNNHLQNVFKLSKKSSLLGQNQGDAEPFLVVAAQAKKRACFPIFKK